MKVKLALLVEEPPCHVMQSRGDTGSRTPPLSRMQAPASARKLRRGCLA